MPAFLAPIIGAVGRVAASGAVKGAVKAGAVQGITGRVSNMIQGQKDGESGSKNESLEGWFPGK
jgi:hypothetical protein